VKLLRFRKGAVSAQIEKYDSATAYALLLERKFKMYKGDRALAFAEAVGSLSVELFREQGDAHVMVLRHYGLADGMAVYDLGCGCGRTAQALQRSGWHGRYTGADIVAPFIDELKTTCPGYEAWVHNKPTLRADDATLDLVFHWSVFTHLSPEECFLYLKDSFRALKPGGKTVFSFLEAHEPLHQRVFATRVQGLERGSPDPILDTYLHKDWIVHWAAQLGFNPPVFTHGEDATHHPPFWQTLAAMEKPA
jgi:SAM-dependent methyltransferase